MLKLLINSVWDENHVNGVCVLVNPPLEWAFVNAFRALGQTSLIDLLLRYCFIICPPSPLPPCPTLLSMVPPFLLPLYPLPAPSCPRTLPSFLSLSKVYMWLLSLGKLPSVVYLFLIIVFGASVTYFRWIFEMSFSPL